MTTSNDAYAEGRYEGKDVILASWYDKEDDGVDKGVRISFIDWTSKSSPKYRNVLLVEPYTSDGQATFRAVKVHGGGMFWYGHNLYVVETWGGLRVFDLRHIYQVSTGKQAIGRQTDGTYHAYDHTTRKLVTAGGVATARWAWQTNIESMQGIASVNGKYFIARSRGSGTRGDLLTWTPGSAARIHTGALPRGRRT